MLKTNNTHFNKHSNFQAKRFSSKFEDNDSKCYINYKIVAEMVGENHKVLDLGCNFGQLGKLLIEKGNEVHGIDISPKAVECSKSLGIMAKVGNLEETIDFENQSFHVIVAMEVIEHILDTDLLLDEIYRVLKTDGRLIITTPNMASLGKRILLLLGRNPYMESSYTYPKGAVGHIRFFTKDSLFSFLKYKIQSYKI